MRLWLLLAAWAGGLRVDSVEEYFASLPERFVPAAAEGFSGVVEWDVAGRGAWHVDIRARQLSVRAGHASAPDVRFLLGPDELLGLANGELDGRWLYLTSRLRVEGSIPMARRLEAILPPAR